MASSYKSLNLASGMKCTGVSSHEGAPALVRNMRLLGKEGGFMQTPVFNIGQVVAAATFWDVGGGSSASESSFPGSTQFRYFGLVGTTYIALSEFCAFSSTTFSSNAAGMTQLKILRQMTVPASVNINTHCLFIPASNTAVGAITLGNTLDVVIDGATTFKWRVNGGSYTTTVTISTAGNTITSGSFTGTLYWLTNSGFNVSDTWSWKRTDACHDDPTQISQNVQTNAVIAKGKLYFIDGQNRVCVYENGIIRTVGYRPIYGRYLTVFANHLIVTWGRSTYTIASQNVVLNSDLNDYDNFWSTDLNEADSFTLPLGGTGSNYVPSVISGVSVLWDRLFIYTQNLSYYTTYQGLPIVFDYIEGPRRGPVAFNQYQQYVNSPSGDYLYDGGGFYHFDGNTFTPIDSDIRGLKVFVQSCFYDKANQEVVFTTYFPIRDFFDNALQNVIQGALIYQERFGSWYYRSMDFNSTTNTIGGYISNPVVGFQSLNTYIVDNRTFYTEYPLAGLSYAKDYNNGASFASPMVVFNQMSFNSLEKQVELVCAYLDINYETSSSNAAKQPAILYFQGDYFSNTKSNSTLPSGQVTLDKTASGISGQVTPIRTSGRLFSFAVEFPVTSSKPSLYATINSVEIELRGAQDPNAAEQ